MKNKSPNFLLMGIFLCAQLCSVFCMEKDIDIEPKIAKSFHPNISIPQEYTSPHCWAKQSYNFIIELEIAKTFPFKSIPQEYTSPHCWAKQSYNFIIELEIAKTFPLKMQKDTLPHCWVDSKHKDFIIDLFPTKKMRKNLHEEWREKWHTKRLQEKWHTKRLQLAFCDEEDKTADGIESNFMKTLKKCPLEIQEKVLQHCWAKQSYNLKEWLILDSCERKCLERTINESKGMRVFGQTWLPVIDKIIYDKCDGSKSRHYAPQCFLIGYYKNCEKSYFHIGHYDNIFRSMSLDMYQVKEKDIDDDSVKFDGPNKEGYGIFYYSDALGNGFVKLISANESVAINYVRQDSPLNYYLELDCTLVHMDLIGSTCTALALQKGKFVLSMTEGRDNKEKKNYVNTYNIVEENNKMSLCLDENMAIPEKINCPSFKKIDYITSRTLIGLSQEGRICIIALEDRCKKFIYPQKIWKKKSVNIQYEIADFAVNADYKKRLMLRTVDNDIFLVNLSLLAIGMPCLHKIINEKDVNLDTRYAPPECAWKIKNMWFDKERFSYIYEYDNSLFWVTQAVNKKSPSEQEEGLKMINSSKKTKKNTSFCSIL